MTQDECASARWGHWTKGQMTNHGMRQFDRIAWHIVKGSSRRDIECWEEISLSRIQLLIIQARTEFKMSTVLGYTVKEVAASWCERRKICVDETSDAYAEMSRAISGLIECAGKFSRTYGQITPALK